MKYLNKLLAGLSLLVFVSSVQAADLGRYNANTICTNYWGSQSGSFNHKTSGLHNGTASSKWTTCAVDGDSVATTTGTAHTWIHYQGTGNVYCTMYSYNSGGHTAMQSRNGNRTGTGWFSIPGLSAESYWGNIVLYCKVPAGGILGTIGINED